MTDRIGMYEITEPPTSAELRQRVIDALGSEATGSTIPLTARDQETQQEASFTCRVVTVRPRDDHSLTVIGENIGGTLLNIHIAGDGEQPATLNAIRPRQ